MTPSFPSDDPATNLPSSDSGGNTQDRESRRGRQAANQPRHRTGRQATCPLRRNDMRGLLALGLLGLFTVGVATGGDKGDAAKLQGKWVGEVKGKKVEFTIEKDNFTFDFAGEAV